MIDKDIRHLKLMNGEEVISFVKEDENNFILEMPLKMHNVLNNENQAFFFTKWQPLSADDFCSIDRNNILSDVMVHETVKVRYIQLCLEYRQESAKEPLDWMESSESYSSSSEDYNEHDEFIDDMLDYEMGSDTEVYH